MYKPFTHMMSAGLMGRICTLTSTLPCTRKKNEVQTHHAIQSS